MHRRITLLSLLLLGLLAGQPAFVAESGNWQRFDQSADLQRLAQHDNDSMHFLLLQSKVQDKNQLWQAFSDQLAAFGQARYEALKPIVLEADIESLQEAVGQGRLSYAELTTFYIYRIRAIETDPARYLNAVISLNPQAVNMARQADTARRQGRAVDPQSMFGIPVLLKDNIGASGMPTTAGALALKDNVTRDAFITEQLKAAGAVILGKANLSEWAYFFCEECPSGYSAMGGQTLNPYGRFEYGTGGSSSGSGVAAAANLATVTVGSETSGSILSPASSNSAVGLKPTTGSLSRSGIVPISSTLDTAGPITRSVRDAAILFNAMAGYDENDLAMPLLSNDLQIQIRQISLTGMRLGAVQGFLDNPYYADALSTLSGAGALIVESALPDVDTEGFGTLLGADMVRDLVSYLQAWGNSAVSIDSIAALREFNNADSELRAPYGQELIDMMADLQLGDAELAVLRERLQDAASRALDNLFQDNQIQLLLSYNNRNAGLAALANYPALTIPMGYEDDGRPIGLTLIAPSFQEQLLVDVGLQFERLSQARRAPENYP